MKHRRKRHFIYSAFPLYISYRWHFLFFSTSYLLCGGLRGECETEKKAGKKSEDMKCVENTLKQCFNSLKQKGGIVHGL